MSSNELEKALGDAEDAFQRRPENPEVGLEYVSNSSVLQLRKACRLLDAARFLLDRNGHFTVIIEASFVAIERSIQFYVEEKGIRRRRSTTHRGLRRRCPCRTVLAGCGRPTRKALDRESVRVVLPDWYRGRVSRRDGLLAGRDASRGGRGADADAGLSL